MVVTGILSVVASLSLPEYLRSRREAEYWEAHRFLFAIVEAEGTYQSRCGLFWVRDMRGLADFELIDRRLALADGTYTHAYPRNGYYFAMLEGYEGEPPWDDGTGRGGTFAVSMYSVYEGSEDFRTYIWCSDCRRKSAYSRQPIRRMFEGPKDRVSWMTW